jgi:hypothetical protein
MPKREARESGGTYSGGHSPHVILSAAKDLGRGTARGSPRFRESVTFPPPRSFATLRMTCEGASREKLVRHPTGSSVASCPGKAAQALPIISRMMVY